MSAAQESSPAPAAAYSKDRPFPAQLSERRLLSRPGSGKSTWHIVIDIAGSGLTYEAGDSLGVYPVQDPALVEAVLQALVADGTETVQLPKDPAPISLREALSARCALNAPTVKALQVLAAAADPAEKGRIEALLAPEAKESTQAWLAERDHLDLLREFAGARPSPQVFVDQLRRLMPRLYSIASSPKLHPTQVHLTVAEVRYQSLGRERLGVCSTFLAGRAPLGERAVPVFTTSSHFKLPEDGARDVLMIGPGTGVAPFRAFLQERQATAARGRNWLFFGDQHRATDFLYEEEWEQLRRSGVLTRLDLAWSRDQAHKVYVQDRMREAGAELWAWLQAGAHLYVCGDAKRMAKDVEAALLAILSEHGGLEASRAADYLKQLKKEHRYQKDVY